MSLTLLESCQQYERHARRNKVVLSFAEFNKQHFTCLPANESVQTAFVTALAKARKAEGLPIRGRLFSLYRRLSKSDVESVAQKVEPVAAPATNSFTVTEPRYEKAMRMNIRPPEVKEDVFDAPEPEPDRWTKDDYVKAVQDSGLQAANGLMVHFIPEVKGTPLSGLASKLTKNAWEVIRGKSAESTLKMKDGTTMDLTQFELNKEDVRNFVRNRKKKVQGPYFVRFSSI